MCGVSGCFGRHWNQKQLEAMVAAQRHRGPDAEGVYLDPSKTAGLGHNRLSIIDLSPAGRQPMSNRDGSLRIVFNGEIYNYLELSAELSDYEYRTRTDTEVILAAYERWGAACLDRLIGMFAILIWDEREQKLFAARDRFGVKPLYYHFSADGDLSMASEIKALHAAGITAEPDEVSWASYLTHGLHDHSERTFWKGVHQLPPGHCLIWQIGMGIRIARWYDLAERSGEAYDSRPVEETQEEYLSLLTDSARLRFRSDVPVGVNLSGGLDSSTLLALIKRVQGESNETRVFTFTCGDSRYDETPWVRQMLERTGHPLTVTQIVPEDVPSLAESVQAAEDEPFGGLPTLAYAKLFADARQHGVIALIDGQGMDEQWAGYDYYVNALDQRGERSGQWAVSSGKRENNISFSPANCPLPTAHGSPVQGAKDSPVMPDCLTPEFRAVAESLEQPAPFSDRLRNLQYRDARFTKIPRVLRFNDRVSMRVSTELREPFLDHRLFELALRQPPERKIKGGIGKWMLRQMAGRMLPEGVVEAPKRPLQTPQREWLRGPLSHWAEERIEAALERFGGLWLETAAVRSAWKKYRRGESDNSFYVWQWIGLDLAIPPGGLIVKQNL
ncbi:MAG TPA: asparagine synthase (glutamine-hydrolyzing) [Blastocatellia bacterium]|nr:asparagine synthase (glutamine-hydrolyzing) [Blastocatellia bacterium]